MSAKDLIIEFINLVFLVVLVGFCIVFFIAGDRLKMFTEFIKSLVPLAVIGVFFLIKIKFNRRELKKRKAENNMNITISLTFIDKILFDIINYSLPAVLIILAITVKGKVEVLDIIQALFVFAVLYLWQKSLYKKAQ